MNDMNTPLTWIEISKSAFTHNIQQYKSVIGDTASLALVVKSNAYGHGMALIAQLAQDNPHVAWLCTVNTAEALALRAAGITKPILVMSYYNTALEPVLENNIDLVVYDEATLHAVHTAALKTGIRATIHIKVDTGLSRVGKQYPQVIEFIEQAHALPTIRICGMFTHFADAESDNQSFVHQQLNVFNTIITTLEQQGITISHRHTSCSAAITATTATHGNLARLGIGAYGLWPSPENKAVTLHQFPSFSLRPVMQWKTKIIQLKTVPAGSFIGYDRTHQTPRPARLALLPVGYYEGYDRGLSNKGMVIINGQPALVVGRVAMNMTMVDVTDCNDVGLGDEVLLLGDHPWTTAEVLAATLDTINYEVVARISAHAERVLVP